MIGPCRADPARVAYVVITKPTGACQAAELTFFVWGVAMTAKDFWPALEFRICGELAGVPDNAVRFWWCDGLIPEPTSCGPEVRGDVWMCNGPRQYKWRFTLKLPRGFDPSGDDWSTVLPAKDVTGWL